MGTCRSPPAFTSLAAENLSRPGAADGDHLALRRLPILRVKGSNLRFLVQSQASCHLDELGTTRVGMAGFEPATFRIRTGRADQAALHPVVSSREIR